MLWFPPVPIFLLLMYSKRGFLVPVLEPEPEAGCTYVKPPAAFLEEMTERDSFRDA